MNLSKNIDLIQVANLSSAATKTSSAINVSGCEGCLFIVALSTKRATSSGITAYLTGSTAISGTYVAYGPSMTVTTTSTGTKDYSLLAIDLVKPLKEFAKVVVAGGSSGSMYLSSIVGIRYGVRNPGSTWYMGGSSAGAGYGSTTVGGSTVLISPTSS